MQTVSIMASLGFSTSFPFLSIDFNCGIVLMTIPTIETATKDIDNTETTWILEMKTIKKWKSPPGLLCSSLASPSSPRSSSGILQTCHPQNHLPPPSSPSWSCPPSARSPAPSSQWTCRSSSRPGGRRWGPNSGDPLQRQGRTSRPPGAAFPFDRSWGWCWRTGGGGRRRTRSRRWSSRCRGRWSPGGFELWREVPVVRGGREREGATTPVTIRGRVFLEVTLRRTHTSCRTPPTLMVSRLFSSLDLFMIWGSGIRSIGSVKLKWSMGRRKERPEFREFESPPCVKPRALSRADTRSSTSKREHCFSVYPDHTLALGQDGYRMPIIAPQAAGFRWKRKRRRMVPKEEQSEPNINATMKFLSKLKKKPSSARRALPLLQGFWICPRW